ncbi:MAG: glycosyltransferase, partial [Terriglobales bacterium]
MPRHCHPSNDGSPRGRIVWVLDRLGMGGAERLAVRFAAAASPWRIELVVLHTPPQEALAAWWGPQLAALGDRLHCLPMRSLGDARGWWRLLRLLAGWQPLLVHTHLRYATVWGGAAARLLQRPYVTTVHLGPRPDPDRRQRAAAACERYSRRRAARVIYVSAAQRQAWGAVAAR